MDTTACVNFALGVFLLFVIAAFFYRHNTRKWIGLVLMGVLISSMALFYPYYCATSAVYELSGVRAMSMTLYDSLKALGGGQEIKDLEDTAGLVFESDYYRTAYLYLNYLYLIIGPILTSSFLISHLGDLLDRIRYHLRLRSNYHIFSHLNENSLQIAENLWKKGTVVFCGTKETDKTLVTRARERGALLLHCECDGLKAPLNLLGYKKMNFYLVDKEEDWNLSTAEALINLHRNKWNRKVAINAFAESGTGIQVVENMRKGEVAVRFIDMTALLCNQLLLKYPLYDLPAGRKDISVMIVGCDKTGMRMLKTISWCGVLDGYSLKIRVYDKNAKVIADKFKIQCPEAMERCVISFVEVDAESAAFEEAVLDPVKGSPDATYIVMAMGEDERNIAVADRLFRLFRHQSNFGWTPQILVRIRSAVKSGVYLQRDNKFLENRKIRLFGSMSDVYGKNTLFYTYLERLAFAVDLCYNGKLPEEMPTSMPIWKLCRYLHRKDIMGVRKAFTQNEYNRRSSMATALHIAGKLHSVDIHTLKDGTITDANAEEFRKKLTSENDLLIRLAENEHIRWNNFMRSEGYCRATEKEFRTFYKLHHKNKDVLSKRHLTMVPWEELDDVTKLFNGVDQPYQETRPKNEREAPKDFIQNDKDIIEAIPKIITLANKLQAKKLDEIMYL